MKQYKTTIVDGYILIVDESEIKENTNTFNEGLNGDWFWNSLYNFIARTGDITSFDYKIIAHLPLNNSPILQGVSLLPAIQQEDDVEKLANEYFTDTNPEESPYQNGLHIGFKGGYSKAKEKYKYTEHEIRMAYMQGYNRGALNMPNEMENYIQSTQQPKIPVAFNLEKEEYRVKSGTIEEHKTGEAGYEYYKWIGEWVY